MTREELIRMAREAGWKDLREFDSEMHDDIFMGKTADLEHFAAIVAAAEREACAKICDDRAFQFFTESPFFVEMHELADKIRARGQA